MNREYRIQEFYDYEKRAPYFVIQRKNLIGEWGFTDTPKYDDLKTAKHYLKVMKCYNEPKYHYVDEEKPTFDAEVFAKDFTSSWNETGDGVSTNHMGGE